MKKALFSTFSLIFVFFFVFGLLNSKVNAYSEKQNEQLMENISKDYRKKFCNGIAFGLSKESAMNFANKENKLLFYNKNGIDGLNKVELANKISIEVVEYCGYKINLSGQEGINRFEDDLINMKNTILEEN